MLQAQVLDPALPNVNGPVTTISKAGDTLFLGGSFSKVYEQGALCDTFARFDISTGVFSREATENVYRAIPDGHGGLFLCSLGSMRIGDSIRSSLAHIDSTGHATAAFRNFFTGGVEQIAYQNNTLYFSGFFDAVFDSTESVSSSGGVAFSYADATLYKGFPKVNGQVNTVVPDGNGGWYIGGSFTQVGATARNHVARIDSSGNVLSWNPVFSSTAIVYDLERSDSGTIYIAGLFNTINGTSRRNLAEVDTITGSLTAWNPYVINEVNDILITDSIVYLAGYNRLAGVYRSTGAATSLNLVMSGSIYSYLPKMAIKDSLLFLGGSFTYLGGQPRINLAAVNIYTNTVSNTLNPSFNNDVTTLAVHDNKLYVGGVFSYVNGINRNGLVAFDIASGALTSWNPQASGAVKSITVSGNKMIVACGFSRIGGGAHAGLAILDIATGLASDWDNVLASPNVRSIGVSGNKIYVGQDANSTAGGKSRAGLAAIDVNTMQLTDWEPFVSFVNLASINKILPADSIVYIAGSFTGVNAVSRPGLAAVSSQTGAVTSWNPAITVSSVRDLALRDSLLYLAGANAGKAALKAVHTSTGIQSSWNPVVKGSHIICMQLMGNNIFVGGYFDSIGTQPRRNIGAVDLATGLATSLNLSITPAMGVVTVLAAADSMLYIGGAFEKMAGKSRVSLASVNTYTGTISDWNPGPTSVSAINSICFSGNKGCIAGGFTGVGGHNRKGLAAIDTRTNKVLLWAPEAIGVQSIAVSNDRVFIGGFFSILNDVPRVSIGSVDRYTGALDSLKVTVNSPITRIALKDSLLYVSGAFSTIGGLSRGKLASININTGNVTSWNPPVFNNPVNTLLITDSLVYAGGIFTQVGSITRRRLASVRLSDGTLTPWNPDPNSEVKVIAMNTDSTLLFAGGYFTQVGSQSRTGLAAINPVTGALNSWNAQLNNSVNYFRIAGNKIYAQGTFTSAGGRPASYTTCIRMDSATSTDWNIAGLPANISAVFLVDANKVYLGGNFRQTLQGYERSSLAVFTEDTTSVPLPVKLLSFTAQKNDEHNVTLKWATASETNSSYFVVERSTDMKQFESIARVRSIGNSNVQHTYFANDRRTNEPVIYYRLKQVDTDGKQELSSVISVKFEEEENVSMYPNPANGTIYFSHTSSYQSKCTVYDMNGKEVKEFMLEQNGITSVDCSDLQPGMYFVKISNASGVNTLRLVIGK